MSIKSRLYIGFASLVIAAVFLALYAVYQFNNVGGSVGKMDRLALNALRNEQVDAALEKMRRSVLRYAYDHDEPSAKENAEVAKAAIATLQEATKTTTSEERRKFFGELQQEITAGQKLTEELFDNVRQMQKEQAKLYKVGDDLTATTNALIKKAQEGSDESLIQMTDKLNAQLLSLRVANWRTQATLDPKGLAGLADQLKAANATMAAIEGSAAGAAMKAQIDPLKTVAADYAATAQSYIGLQQKVADSYANKIAPEIKKMQAGLAKAIAEQRSGYDEEREGTDGLITRTSTMQEVIAGLALVLGGLLAYFIARSIANPITALTGAMRELAKGNFDVLLPGLNRKDEVGNIAKAVDEFKVKAAEKAQREAEEKAEQDRRAEQERQAALARMAEEFEASVGAIVQSAAAGDFSQRVDLAGKTGLVLNVGTAINSLCDNVAKALDDLSRVLNALADGNLTERITAQYQGNFAVLKDNANKTAERIGTTIAEIKSSAREVTNASAEISTSTTDLSQRTEEQAASLEETSASMEEISATVKKNAENAQMANQSAASTRQVAEHGGQVVAKAVEAMARIEDSSRKISDIIGVIDEIARQTNLLALNAAVEAARAGEAGRGFAVVASEVRMLAQRSSQAAKDIKDLITNSNGQVKEGVDLVNRAGESLTGIVDSIKKVAEIVADIANASAEQASGIEQVGKALAQMDEVTQQNSALVEENAATAKALEDQASAMGQRIAAFRLDQAHDRAESKEVPRRAGAAKAEPRHEAHAAASKPAPAAKPSTNGARPPANPVAQMRTTLATALKQDSEPAWQEF